MGVSSVTPRCSLTQLQGATGRAMGQLSVGAVRKVGAQDPGANPK